MSYKNIYKNYIMVIDFGSQYSQLIVKRIREIGVYCELFASKYAKKLISKFKPSGIILSGGPDSVTRFNSVKIPDFIFSIDVPILGICYGMQAIVVQLGGTVNRSIRSEFGCTKLKILSKSKLINGFRNDSLLYTNYNLVNVWMSHTDQVSSIPHGFKKIASTKNCPYAVIENINRKIYGLQFHPEVTHTINGNIIFKNFVINICKCKLLWSPFKIIDQIVSDIRDTVGNNKVILGLSGGVDSLVTAILLQKALGNKLICIFVDSGILCIRDIIRIISKLKEKYKLNVISINAEKKFFKYLSGVTDPELKRKIIGHVFAEIFNNELKKDKDIKWLAQGTIYSDVIESISILNNNNYFIKSHHNVGGLPKNMFFNLIEPLKLFFKDEVRTIGLKLKIPYDMIYRHPFPGPGLAIRILGEVKKSYCLLLSQANDIFIEELHRYGFYKKVSQAFVVFLPIRSVGIMGDIRKYTWVVSLRAVLTKDFMTAEYVKLPYFLLDCVSRRIINEVDGISRVVYDITSKPPATIEWE
ncbi:glutamine-hydrolyzing GMP synthase [Candidatus Purcelliella pentastirinorum]|uniref:glutamine-hydrolyzing GMP synthase n=1 Tax=Candidatus Purcelliella pentastirinorum TaxID=472834 RepID=UPI0023676CCF|nr:glutamine-hydrolyzing GMP synthase [Candidatus Purcelliella pentastirinorum]WDI78840.1 glutamine-hydrolyzing GMP synthase [Candidatus Purcelliella pentastirinorum]WDR79973.1 glutamine-hydrolyzing GMP synthase [Candidatus Purcelliella pentastirinorum]